MPLPLLLPDAPPPRQAEVALIDAVESGRSPSGGFYAWFGVAAPVEAVYAVLSDHAGMSGWIPRLDKSDVLSSEGDCGKVAFAVPSPIGLVEYTLNRCARGSHIWWELAEGARFEQIRGAYQLKAVPGGTLVSYWSLVVAAIPVPASAQAEIARIGVGDLVEGLRKEVARRAN